MALHKTEAFVLRTYSLAEADKICVFLTKHSGKLRGVAHGARKMKSRFGSALEPLTEVALTYYQKEAQELVSVSTCEIIHSYFHIAARDEETAAAFSYITELLMEFTFEGELHGRTYRLVSAILDAMATGNLVTMLRYFEIWLLKLSGFYPDMSHCPVCASTIPSDENVFLTNAGEPRCFDCSEGRGLIVTPSLRKTIKGILGNHPKAFSGENFKNTDISGLGEINYQIIRHALERDLKSYDSIMRLQQR